MSASDMGDAELHARGLAQPAVSADDVKANPTATGMAHDFDCTHDPCRCGPTTLREAIAKTIEQVAEAQDIHMWSLFPYAAAAATVSSVQT